MKRCPECNRAYSDIIEHCPNCNIPLYEIDSAELDIAPSQLNDGESNSFSSSQNEFIRSNKDVTSKTKKRIIPIISIILVICLFIAGIFFAVGKISDSGISTGTNEKYESVENEDPISKSFRDATEEIKNLDID